jgi:hypothetical protein
LHLQVLLLEPELVKHHLPELLPKLWPELKHQFPGIQRPRLLLSPLHRLPVPQASMCHRICLFLLLVPVGVFLSAGNFLPGPVGQGL